MLKIYTVTACSSSKKAKNWLTNHGIEYQEINLLTADIEKEEFLNILSLTEEGTGDILSKRSRIYKKLVSRLDKLSLGDLLNFIDENRSILRRPLIINDKCLQVGYNEDDIRKFLPRTVRRVEMADASESIRDIALGNNFKSQVG
ncbi:Spx/MgsR family RNA polymerase-binding regulatory protein [Lactococcus garvieae]|uniref:Transcriptional regulator SpxA1 n=1 Tax=Lactococcus garvieae DCC43 TaxID=1231377 RepID=K2PWJ2_9LACT|nr:Spx/MgsR family RNA polymerase-binding regulatory protein [Lactococcus garvieae]EKF51821.1 Transcriptional regulator SpxA1 [Lactococcus garvieae DCC43]QPS71260.1 transcriptional regulator Spx [Lactococcus garvieae]